ncbi:DUF2254 family protein [Novosphingobium sp. M1R2S20]|uniref:DUF2254 family protein n=1 Tax=Novosphingobium rhizovicinum TaxID=3228928 RepID=A0ABV3RDI3_9SPHN
MAGDREVRVRGGVTGSREHLLWSNFWALPCLMIFAAAGLTSAMLALDARGGSAWVMDAGWPLNIPPTTALELASGLVTLHSAFATLYFSITLLVLTLAASNLGVRLIDRWISDRTIRFTLGLLLSLLTSSLIVLLSTGGEAAASEEIPRLSLLVLVCATVGTLGWMANALHHLGRTVHVDTSITRLGQDAATSVSRNRHPGPPGLEPTAGSPIRACNTGYIDAIDTERLLREANKRDAFLVLTHGRGDFMIAGEQIGWVVGAPGEWISQHIACSSFRSDTGGPLFETNLLVEIAARALSPAVNDFYTALSCCDRIAAVLAVALEVHHAPQWLTDREGTPRLELRRERITEYMDGPLKALRQAVAAYPSVAVHMLNLIARLPACDTGDEALRKFLLAHAEALADHATARAELDQDRTDIAMAHAQARQNLSLDRL